LEGVDEVVERCLEDREESKAHADECDHWCYWSNGTGGGPAENEKPTREKDGAEHHWWKACFWNGFVVVFVEFLDVEFVVAGLRLVERGEWEGDHTRCWLARPGLFRPGGLKMGAQRSPVPILGLLQIELELLLDIYEI